MLKNEAVEDAEDIENVFIAGVGNAADTVKEKASDIINNTADMTRRFSANISEKIDRFKKREEEYLAEEFASDLSFDAEISEEDSADNPTSGEQEIIIDVQPVDIIPTQKEEIAATEISSPEAANDTPASQEKIIITTNKEVQQNKEIAAQLLNDPQSAINSAIEIEEEEIEVETIITPRYDPQRDKIISYSTVRSGGVKQEPTNMSLAQKESAAALSGNANQAQ